MEEAQYLKGVAQFAQMVGQDHIDALRQRLETPRVGVAGVQIRPAVAVWPASRGHSRLVGLVGQ